MTDDIVRFDKLLNELKNRAELYRESPPTLISDNLLKKDFELWKMRMKNEVSFEIPRTDGFLFKAYNNIPIVIEKYPFNKTIRRQAIWAIRHPNKKMPNWWW